MSTKEVQSLCSTCNFGQANVIWVRYPDNQLRRLDVVVCGKGLPATSPGAGKPWYGFPLPKMVKLTSDVCDNWIKHPEAQ